MKNKKINYYPEKSEYAKQTLERVLQEWITDKQKITWIVIEPSDKGTVIFTILFLLGIVFIVFIIPALYELYFHHNIKEALFNISFGLIIGFFIFIINGYIRYTKTVISINRKRKKGTISPPRFILTRHNNETKRIKYGQDIILKHFRLPETEKRKYRKIREQLQNLITTETNWQFEYDLNAPWLSDEVRELIKDIPELEEFKDI